VVVAVVQVAVVPEALELLLAPVVVAQQLNLQYYSHLAAPIP
jgi:hypothetical protein